MVFGKHVLIKGYTVAAFILLAALYIVIFFFSSEDADSSSAASTAVTEALLKGYYGIMGQNGKSLSEMVTLLEGFVRKTAHFMEYLGVGFLSYSIIVLRYGPVRKGILFVLGQLVISAGLDEFHQYFVPGRYAAFRDVIIDTAGGVTGIFIILLIKKVLKWKINK